MRAIAPPRKGSRYSSYRRRAAGRSPAAALIPQQTRRRAPGLPSGRLPLAAADRLLRLLGLRLLRRLLRVLVGLHLRQGTKNDRTARYMEYRAHFHVANGLMLVDRTLQRPRRLPDVAMQYSGCCSAPSWRAP